MNCPACHQDVRDTGLGTPLPHHRPDSPEFCPGFIREEVSVTASPHTALSAPQADALLKDSPEFCPGYIRPEPYTYPVGPLTTFPAERAADAILKRIAEAIKEPGRKVRSDSGVKRGPRKKGGDDPVSAPGGPPSLEPERVVSSTFGPLITIPAAPPSTTAISEAPASPPEPRSDPTVYLVLPGEAPSYTDYAEACSKAEEQASQDPGTTLFLVFEARPVDSFGKGVQHTRLGRVRKAKP